MSPSRLLGLTWVTVYVTCSSSSLTGSMFEPAGDIMDEESEVITADSGLRSSIQDDEWEDLADAKASPPVTDSHVKAADSSCA